MLEDIVFCREADASCALAELKKMGFTVIPEDMTAGDKQLIDKISHFKSAAKFRISNGPWGTLMRVSGKIKVEKGVNLYNS